MHGEAPQHVVRFGAFEADLGSGELRKQGLRIKLHNQPFQVLVMLLERPGEVVTREELHARIWASDTFVDFEHGLNTAVNKLREALGDSATNPRFIETLQRRGYRLLASVQTIPPSASEPDDALRPVPQQERPPRRLFSAVAVLVGLALVSIFSWLAVRLWFAGTPERPFVSTPLTTLPGDEIQPSFSPDGRQVAFSWNGTKQDNFDIYVKLIGTENLLRLTDDPAMDISPAWSPDGRHIAFIRHRSKLFLGGGRYFGNLDRTASTPEVILVPAIGGRERKIATLSRATGLAWHPDSKWLAAFTVCGVTLLSVETGETRALVPPFAPCYGTDGAFSPNGRQLAYHHSSGNWSSQLFLIELTPDLRAKGMSTPLKVQGVFPRWLPDVQEILYLNRSETSGQLWRMPISDPRNPRRVGPAGDWIGSMAVSQQGRRLAYERILTDRNIWRLELTGPGAAASGRARSLINSTWLDEAARYSPDGKRIAFISGRSGHPELWAADSDGSRPVQLTSMTPHMAGSPSWSPDGKRILFCANERTSFELYEIDAEGGRPRILTHHPEDDALGSYSRDGRWIYYRSNRTGRGEVWKMPSDGGEPVQITKNGGYGPGESPDGKYLYFTKSRSLWRLPVSGGEEEQLAADVSWISFALSSTGVYFIRPGTPGGGDDIVFLNLATRKTTIVAKTERPTFVILSLSPDERYLLFTQVDQSGSDLMLVENFR